MKIYGYQVRGEVALISINDQDVIRVYRAQVAAASYSRSITSSDQMHEVVAVARKIHHEQPLVNPDFADALAGAINETIKGAK